MQALENIFLLIGALQYATSYGIATQRSGRDQRKMLSLHARIGNQQTTIMETPRKQACMGLEGGSIIKTTNSSDPKPKGTAITQTPAGKNSSKGEKAPHWRRDPTRAIIKLLASKARPHRHGGKSKSATGDLALFIENKAKPILQLYRNHM